MKRISKLLTVITLLALPLILSAGELKKDQITRWIKAFPTVDAWMDQHEDEMDTVMDELDTDDMSMDQMMQAGFEAIKSHPKYGELQKVVKPLGYSNTEELMTDTIQIFKTYTAINFKNEMAENEDKMGIAEFQKQIDQIDQMQGMSEDQKKMMKEQLQAVMGQIGTMMKSFDSVSDADIATLMPFYDQIETLFEDEGEDEGDWNY